MPPLTAASSAIPSGDISQRNNNTISFIQAINKKNNGNKISSPLSPITVSNATTTSNKNASALSGINKNQTTGSLTNITKNQPILKTYDRYS